MVFGGRVNLIDGRGGQGKVFRESELNWQKRGA